MAKFIPIHITWSGNLEWLNIDNVWRIRGYTGVEAAHQGKSIIMRSEQQDDYVSVTETPDELMALIDKASLLVAQISGDT